MTGDTAYFDEMYQPDGGVRPAYSGYCDWFDGQDNGLMRRKHAEAETNFRKTGITFNVYGENEAEERLIPFDMVPRVISAARALSPSPAPIAAPLAMATTFFSAPPSSAPMVSVVR